MFLFCVILLILEVEMSHATLDSGSIPELTRSEKHGEAKNITFEEPQNATQPIACNIDNAADTHNFRWSK